MIASFLAGYGYMGKRGKGILKIRKLCENANVGCTFSLLPDQGEFIGTFSGKSNLV